MNDLPITYQLEKRLWTDKDFDQMGWHDCRIYKIGFTDELALDIDYILQWNKPEVEGLPFTFWVAPATLVFKNIQQLSFELDTAFENAIEIEEIEKTGTPAGIRWTIITQHGHIEFLSDGYEQFIRQEPLFQFGQTISFIERYGKTLDRTTDQYNPNRNREDILEQQKKKLEHYELVKQRQLKRQEQANLENARNNNEIDTKTCLIKKKEIKEKLDYYDYWLKGTRFQDW